MRIKVSSKSKISFNELALYSSLCVLIIIKLLQVSLLPYKYDLDFLYYLAMLFRILIIITVILDHRYFKRKELPELVLFMIIVLIQYIATKNTDFFDIFIIAVAAKSIDYRRIINLFLYTLLIGTLFIVGLYFLGAMPVYEIYRDSGAVRYAFGFNHPNIFARMIMLMVMLFIVKRGQNRKIWDYILIALAAIFVYVYPNSITATLMLVLFDLGLIVMRWYKIIFKKELLQTRLFKFLSVTIILVIVIGCIYYLQFGQWAGNTSSSFASRFLLASQALKQYGISIWGQAVEIVGSSQVYFGNSSTEYFVIDNLFFLLPIKYGILATAYFIYQFILSVYRYIKRRDVIMTMICVLLAIASVAENVMLPIYSSFIFICANKNIKPGDNKMQQYFYKDSQEPTIPKKR